MKRELLFKPRLVGRRFQHHAIPMDVLKDLAKLEPFLVEVAKWKYFQANPDRKRVPRGFTDDVTLTLTAIDEGSAMPCLEIEYEEKGVAQATLPGITPDTGKIIYFKQARDAIINTIEAAREEDDRSKTLPANLLSFFDPIGRSLRDDEAMEFNPANPDKPARLDRQTRRRLVLVSSRANNFTEEATLRGLIPEADQEKMTFELQVIGGPRVKAAIEPQYMETVIEAFNGYKDNVKVQLRGIARFNQYERLERIESVEQITILDPDDISARLDELRGLKDGWLDGKGKAPDGSALDWLEKTFNALYPEELPAPYIYPTPEGGLSLEWELAGKDISLEISFPGKTGQWHVLNLETGEEVEETFDLSDPQAWQALAEHIRAMGGGNNE